MSKERRVTGLSLSKDLLTLAYRAYSKYSSLADVYCWIFPRSELSCKHPRVDTSCYMKLTFAMNTNPIDEGKVPVVVEFTLVTLDLESSDT